VRNFLRTSTYDGEKKINTKKKEKKKYTCKMLRGSVNGRRASTDRLSTGLF